MTYDNPSHVFEAATVLWKQLIHKRQGVAAYDKKPNRRGCKRPTANVHLDREVAHEEMAWKVRPSMLFSPPPLRLDKRKRMPSIVAPNDEDTHAPDDGSQATYRRRMHPAPLEMLKLKRRLKEAGKRKLEGMVPKFLHRSPRSVPKPRLPKSNDVKAQRKLFVPYSIRWRPMPIAKKSSKPMSGAGGSEAVHDKKRVRKFVLRKARHLRRFSGASNIPVVKSEMAEASTPTLPNAAQGPCDQDVPYESSAGDDKTIVCSEDRSEGSVSETLSVNVSVVSFDEADSNLKHSAADSDNDTLVDDTSVISISEDLFERNDLGAMVAEEVKKALGIEVVVKDAERGVPAQAEQVENEVVAAMGEGDAHNEEGVVAEADSPTAGATELESNADVEEGDIAEEPSAVGEVHHTDALVSRDTHSPSLAEGPSGGPSDIADSSEQHEATSSQLPETQLEAGTAQDDSEDNALLVGEDDDDMHAEIDSARMEELSFDSLPVPANPATAPEAAQLLVADILIKDLDTTDSTTPQSPIIVDDMDEDIDIFCDADEMDEDVYYDAEGVMNMDVEDATSHAPSMASEQPMLLPPADEHNIAVEYMDIVVNDGDVSPVSCGVPSDILMEPERSDHRSSLECVSSSNVESDITIDVDADVDLDGADETISEELPACACDIGTNAEEDVVDEDAMMEEASSIQEVQTPPGSADDLPDFEEADRQRQLMHEAEQLLSGISASMEGNAGAPVLGRPVPWYEPLFPEDEDAASFAANHESEYQVDERESSAPLTDEVQNESPSALTIAPPVCSDIDIDSFVSNGPGAAISASAPSSPQPPSVLRSRSDAEAPTTSINSEPETTLVEENVANLDPYELVRIDHDQSLLVDSTISTTFATAFSVGDASVSTSSQDRSSDIGPDRRKRSTRRRGMPYASRDDYEQIASSANLRDLDQEVRSKDSLSCIRDKSAEEEQERKRARALRKLIKRQARQAKENEFLHQKRRPTGIKLRFNPRANRPENQLKVIQPTNSSMDDLVNALSASTIKDSSSQSSADDDLLAAFSSFSVAEK